MKNIVIKRNLKFAKQKTSSEVLSCTHCAAGRTSGLRLPLFELAVRLCTALKHRCKRTDNILTPYIKSAIGVSAVFITLGSILILENIGGITSWVVPTGCADPGLYEKTFMFAFFIYAIIFNSLNTRSEKYNLLEHIGENKNFILVMGAIFILQTIIIEVGGKVFNTTMLEPKALLVSMALAVLIIPVDLIRKAVVRR